MSLFNPNPRLLLLLKEMNLLSPFVLIDVGCSGGIGSDWQHFGDFLTAYGFDPQKAEIDRLNRTESNPNISYHAYFVGDPDSPYSLKNTDFHKPSYFNPFNFKSAWAAHESTQDTSKFQSNPIFSESTEEWITIPTFVEQREIADIDFVKIDTDGNDLEILISCMPLVRTKNILGFMIESNFTGSEAETQNNFANVDKVMKKNGFVLFNLSMTRYSSRDLPMPFVYDIFAQTTIGQPIQCDLIYLRDGGSVFYENFWKSKLSIDKIVKLACLFDLMNLPDMTASLINKYKEQIGETVDPSMLLNMITPLLGGVQLSYDEYIRRFKEDPTSFFPSKIRTIRNMRS